MLSYGSIPFVSVWIARSDRRVSRETVFDYFRRMQYPVPPQYRDRNDDFWR